MKIEVEISRNERIGENQWVPILMNLIIVQPTTSHPNAEISLFIDLTEDEARELAQSLIHHADKIKAGVPKSL